MHAYPPPMMSVDQTRDLTSSSRPDIDMVAVASRTDKHRTAGLMKGMRRETARLEWLSKSTA